MPNENSVRCEILIIRKLVKKGNGNVAWKKYERKYMKAIANWEKSSELVKRKVRMTDMKIK